MRYHAPTAFDLTRDTILSLMVGLVDELPKETRIQALPEICERLEQARSFATKPFANAVAKNGDLTSYVLTGKKLWVEAAIKVVANRIAKPIKCADDVDASRKLPKIRNEVKNGTAVELSTAGR